jgi:hypothetical protein
MIYFIFRRPKILHILIRPFIHWDHNFEHPGWNKKIAFLKGNLPCMKKQLFAIKYMKCIRK